MKKLLSVVLCLAVMLSLGSVFVFASGEPSGSVAGTYTLEETNSYGLDIVWTLVLGDGGAYALTEENLVAGVVTYTGTYTASGSVVTCSAMAEAGPPVWDWADPAGFVVTVSADGTFVPGAEAASGEAMSVEDAFVEYIHEWLLAEMEVNSNLTIEQVEDEFMPLVEIGDYVSFPAEMLWSGMLNSGVPMTFEEFAAQYVPAASGEVAGEVSKGGWPLSGSGDTSLDAYKAYLKAYMDCVPEMDGHEEELYGLIDSGVFTDPPVVMAFEDWFEENAMSYDAFAAANGVYNLHRFGETNPANGAP